MASTEKNEVPSMASDAVLIRSEEMPKNTPTVKGKNQFRQGMVLAVDPLLNGPWTKPEMKDQMSMDDSFCQENFYFIRKQHFEKNWYHFEWHI